MELRTYNVERVYSECVKCCINDELGVDKVKLEENRENIISMLQQLPEKDMLCRLHFRNDGETWTRYLQIIKMIVLLGEKIGMVSFEKPLNEFTRITIKREK